MHCVWRSSMGERMQSQNRHLMTLDGGAPRKSNSMARLRHIPRGRAWLDGCDIVARMTRAGQMSVVRVEQQSGIRTHLRRRQHADSAVPPDVAHGR